MDLPYTTLGDVMGPGQSVIFLLSLITQPMLQLFILFITALSGFYMIKGTIELSPLEAAKMSAAHLDFNPKIGENFARQKSDTVVGFSLLVFSLLVQAYSISQPLRWADVDGIKFGEFVFVIVTFIVLIGVAKSWQNSLIKRYLSELKDGLKKVST